MKLTDIKTSGGSDFFKLQSGDNKIRLVTEFEERYTFFDKEENRSVSVSSPDEMYKGEAPKTRYMAYAIDRVDGVIKLLEVGPSIVKQLQDLAKSDDYKFEGLPDYDITIQKTGQNMSTRYSVLAARENTELTPEELLAVADLKPVLEVCKSFVESSKELFDKAAANLATTGSVSTEGKDDIPFDK